jgi:hypothetical protein
MKQSPCRSWSFSSSSMTDFSTLHENRIIQVKPSVKLSWVPESSMCHASWAYNLCENRSKDRTTLDHAMLIVNLYYTTICSWKYLSNCLHLLSKHSWDMVKLQFRELVVRRGSSGNLWIRQHRAAPAGAPDGSKAVVGGELCCLEEGNGLDLQG